MKKLIKLLDEYERIDQKMKALGYIGTISSSPKRLHFDLEGLILLIKSHDLDHEIIDRQDREYPLQLEVIVGEYTLFALISKKEPEALPIDRKGERDETLRFRL